MHSDNANFTPNTVTGATDHQKNIADRSIANDRGITANTHVNNVYVGYYKVIAGADQILAIIAEAKFDETAKAYLKGQALFLRAYSYFELTQFFGSIPLHLEPVLELRENIFANISERYALPASESSLNPNF